MNRIIIDVREPGEFARSHVEGAINIPPMEIMSGSPALRAVPKDAEVILYCISGARSNAAMHILKAQGFTNIKNGINKDHVTAMLS